MAIKLDLDIPALERLIGGDSEVEVNLRRGIVEEFARRHLSSVLKDENFQRFLAVEAKAAKTALDETIGAHIGVRKSAGTYDERFVSFTPQFHAAIQVEAEKRYKALIEETAVKVYEEKVAPKLDGWVDRVFVSHVSDAVRKHVEKVTEDMIRAQVKERLEKVAAEMVKV